MKVCIRYLIGVTAAVIALSLSGCASHDPKYGACAKSNPCVSKMVSKLGQAAATNTEIPDDINVIDALHSADFLPLVHFWKQQEKHDTPLWVKATTLCDGLVNGNSPYHSHDALFPVGCAMLPGGL